MLLISKAVCMHGEAKQSKLIILKRKNHEKQYLNARFL